MKSKKNTWEKHTLWKYCSINGNPHKQVVRVEVTTQFSETYGFVRLFFNDGTNDTVYSGRKKWPALRDVESLTVEEYARRRNLTKPIEQT